MRSNPLEEDLNHVLLHTRDLWEELRNQRIFISGGTGFFGKWLLETFAWANDRLDLNASVVVLTRRPDIFISEAPHLALNPAITLKAGDVHSFEFPEGDFGYLIHAAANTASGAEAPEETRTTIVDGTHRMLEFAKRSSVVDFLFVSSGAVYCKQPLKLTHITEEFADATCNNRSPYAAGKKIAEQLCIEATASSGTRCKIARCFAFVGPLLPLDNFAIGNFIRDSLARVPICLSGDGTPFRSYLYGADLAIWLWTILLRGKSCRPYNVGSEVAVSIGELAGRVAALLENPHRIQIPVAAAMGVLPERYVPCTRRAQLELGLRERVNLDRAIVLTAQWHRNRNARRVA